MRNSGVQQSSSSFSSSVTGAAQLILQKWEQLAKTIPFTSTLEATDLLEKTVKCVTDVAPDGDQNAARVLLGQESSSSLIWRTLRRQCVPWRQAMNLAPAQLDVVPVAQRSFIEKRASLRPWSTSRIILASWELPTEDESLIQQYRSMKSAAYVVELARLVSSALRERPALPGRLLPVPYSVVAHCYHLGEHSSQDAEVALELTRHLSLAGRSLLSPGAFEKLVLQHARLEGLCGRWSDALSAVLASPQVRLTIKKEMQTYVTDIAATKHSPSTYAPFQQLGGPVSPCVSGSTTGQLSSGDQHGMHCVKSLRSFTSLPSDAQTYGTARHLLNQVSPHRSDFILLATAALRASTRRMYSGTLTRRLTSYTRRGNWADAVALACAANYYDIAASLVPQLQSSLVTFSLPSELTIYMDTVEEVHKRQDDLVRASRGDRLLTAAQTASLSLPETLAYALEDGNTVPLILAYSPHALVPSRLRSFLLASCRTARPSDDEDGGVEVDDSIDCATFQSQRHTQLVCAAASISKQLYFQKVIPKSMRAHHFERHSRGRFSEGGMAHDRAGEEVVQPHPALGEGCSASSAPLLQDAVVCTNSKDLWKLFFSLVDYLGTRYTLEGGTPTHDRPQLTELLWLRHVSFLLATGISELPLSERHHILLCTLKASRLLRVTLDAAALSMAVRAVPSTVLDAEPLALPAALTAHCLIGNWKLALQVSQRLQRKQAEGLLKLDTDAHPRIDARKYKPPPPTLLDACAQLIYYTPHSVSQRHLRQLYHGNKATASFPLLLQELQRGDTRQLCEVLSRLSAKLRRPRKIGRVYERRKLLGAAFALLNSGTSLFQVVKACNVQRVGTDDLDDHGLQRLIRVLPLADAVRVLLRLESDGRSAHDHWVSFVMANHELSPVTVATLAAMRPHSVLLGSIHCFCIALDINGDVVLCLKAALRLLDAMGGNSEGLYFYCFTSLLHRLLASDIALASLSLRGGATEGGGGGAFTTEGVTAGGLVAYRLSRRLYNRLQEDTHFTEALRQCRRAIPTLFREPANDVSGSMGALLLIGVLHSVLRHRLQMPLVASLTSRLLGIAAREEGSAAGNWMAALYYFRGLQRPTKEEKRLLVMALRHGDTAVAATVLLNNHRFMRGFPEQVVVWTNENYGSMKWMQSLELLAAEKWAPLPGSPSETWQQSISFIIPPTISQAIAKWNTAECVRCAKLLSRLGFLHYKLGRPLSTAEVSVAEDFTQVKARTQAILAALVEQSNITSNAVYQECHVCYAALQDFAGWRHVIPLPAALLEKIYTAVPAKYHPLMQHSTEAVLMPNFTTDPRPSISVGVADYTVEIKPKAAWRRPEAVGIIADGVTYYIQSSKYYHCRYAHMQPFKQLRDGATGTTASVLSPYCPNYLYRADLSSREGLRRLAVSPQNNLKVLCHHPSHRVRIEAGLQRLLVEEDELDIIADALDASLVLPILQHLQLYGTAPQQRGCTSQGEAARSDVAEAVDSMVLDIELLNRWASAQDPQSVKWLVLPPLNEDAERNGDVHCQCCGGERAVGLPVTPPCFQDASPVSPPMDLKTSIERFYASTTARDVSLLVAVSLHDTKAQNGAAPPMDKNAKSTEGVVIQVGNRLCRVAVVDLDDKQHKSLQHYAKHDASIVDAWKNHCH